jgi:hypothetical protein
MKAREYGAWPARNILSGGQHPSYDEYNREYKKVRYTSAEEYASRNVKEYHHYSEYNDLTSSNDDRKQLGSNKNSRSSRMRVFQQVICLLAGSTIIVSTYQAMTRQAQAEPTTPTSVVQQDEDNPVTEGVVVASVEWIWDEANKTAIVRLFDSEGKLIGDLPAEISLTTVDPTCTKEGINTYTATAIFNDKEYSDSFEETLTPLGHAFDEGREFTLDNGKSVREFECSRCHEKFRFQTEMTEND